MWEKKHKIWLLVDTPSHTVWETSSIEEASLLIRELKNCYICCADQVWQERRLSGCCCLVVTVYSRIQVADVFLRIYYYFIYLRKFCDFYQD